MTNDEITARGHHEVQKEVKTQTGGRKTHRRRAAHAGADECCVTTWSGARADLFSDHSGFMQEVDTYELAV